LHSEAARASARAICGEANPAFHPPQLGLLRRMGALRGTPRQQAGELLQNADEAGNSCV